MGEFAVQPQLRVGIDARWEGNKIRLWILLPSTKSSLDARKRAQHNPPLVAIRQLCSLTV